MASKLLLGGVFVLDLIAFAFAVAAEHRRSTAIQATSQAANGTTVRFCAYSSNIATSLGVVSLLFLLAAQAVIMVATKCLCCGKALQPGRHRVWSIVTFIISWFTFFIAEVCLLAGSVQNSRHTHERSNDNPPVCVVVRRGIFAAGAAFIVFTGILSSFFYINYSNADKDFPPPSRDSGIRMGQI